MFCTRKLLQHGLVRVLSWIPFQQINLMSSEFPILLMVKKYEKLFWPGLKLVRNVYGEKARNENRQWF